MAASSSIVISLTSIPPNSAAEALSASIDTLRNAFGFKYSAFSQLSRLTFEGSSISSESEITPHPPEKELSSEVFEGLMSETPWLRISGAIHVSKNKFDIVDCEVFCYPSHDTTGSCCIRIVIALTPFTDIYGEAFSDFDSDAAQRLLKVSVLIGTNSSTDGFQLILASSVEAAQAFTGPQLLSSLIHPMSVQECRDGGGLRRGWVTGLRASLVDTAALKALEGVVAKDDFFETLNGFYIVNGLTKVD